MPEVAREPFLRSLSENVRLFYGYKDGRAELKVKTPVGVEVPATISPEKVVLVKKAFDEAYTWAMKPEDDRKDPKEVERILDDRGKVSFGYPDGSVKIYVRPIKMSPWIPIRISRQELLQGKAVMDEVFLWKELPEELRSLQGVQ